MRFTLVFIFLILFIISFSGCAHVTNSRPSNTTDLRLYGKWKSDLKKTMEFNSKYAKLNDKQTDFFNKIFGQMIIEYREDGTVISYFPEIHDTSKFSVEEYNFSVVAKGAECVVITDPLYCELLQTIYFDLSDNETYWIYVNKHPIFRADNMHIREYFTKIE